jgi:ParB/RepB/Spo0J family partition protein
MTTSTESPFEIELVPLDQLQPNPYQTRESEDPEHVSKIAESIKAHGLIQPAVGRRAAEGIVQLALGHTRLAAYRMLLPNNPEYYGRLPVRIQRLTDLEMFEYAVAENNDRKDLSPIELAKAMETYRTVFKKSSKQIGELFHVDGATVRNYLRLLNLPEPVQEHVAGGEISQATARKLLTLQTVAPGQVAVVAKDLAESAKTEGAHLSEDAINQKVAAGIKNASNAYVMWERWQSGPARGGAGLWKLSEWTPAPLPVQVARAKAILKDFPQWSQGLADQTDDPAELIDEYIVAAQRQAVSGDPIQEYLVQMSCPPALAELIATIVTPPVCTRCPFYAQIDGAHYCGIRLCWSNKKAAWIQAELTRLSQETGVQIYDPKVDGKDFQEGLKSTYGYKNGKYGTWETEFAGWWAADPRPDHLRLKAASVRSWGTYDFTESDMIQVISIRPEVREQKVAERQAEAERKQTEAESRTRHEQDSRNRDLAQVFFQQAAAPVFAQIFEELPAGVVRVMVRAFTRDDLDEEDLPEKPAQRERTYREYLAYTLVYDQAGTWENLRQGPVVAARHLEGLATELGLTLPADWTAIAERFAAGETGESLMEVFGEDEEAIEDTPDGEWVEEGPDEPEALPADERIEF